MPRTKKKPAPTLPPVSPPSSGNGTTGEVLTLTEAAAYLRLPEAAILQLVETQNLPARKLGQEWRFLKPAIQDWLRTGPPVLSEKEVWLSLAGAWKDDPTVEEMLKEIYKQRGRPMTEEES